MFINYLKGVVIIQLLTNFQLLIKFTYVSRLTSMSYMHLRNIIYNSCAYYV